MIDSVRLFSPDGSPLGELSVHAGTLETCVMSLEINGEHSLSIDTTVQLNVGTRALTQDPSGRWREWVIDEVEQEHSDTEYGTCSYHLIWSLQYDLQGTNAGTIRQPGMAYDDGVDAIAAMNAALEGSMWENVAVFVNTKTAVVMNYNSAWDRLNQVVKYWGGEIDDTIVVNDTGVTRRLVDLTDHVGDKEPTRRLEWRHDLTSISRSPDPGPYFCRVIPTGNGESITSDDGESTINEPLTLESRIGRKYLSDPDAEALFKVRKPNGEWFYPTTTVSYSTDDEDELRVLSHEDLYNHTRPGISYSGTVSQLAEAGMDIGDGVNLGDEVQIVDYGFNKDYPLVTQERVIKIEWDLINQEDKKVTIGKFKQTLEKTMAGMVNAVGVEKVAAIGEIPMPNISVPQYEPMTIETPNGDYTITPADYEPLDLSGYMPTDYGDRLETLENLMSSLTGIEYDPETDAYYDRDGEEITPGFDETYATDMNSFVPNTVAGGSAFSLLGDGWEHQIDGVTQSKGVINFVTVRNASGGGSSGGSSSGGSSGGGSSYTPATNKTDLKQAQQEKQDALKLAAQKRKNRAKNKESAKKNASKANFKVTAANLDATSGVDININGKTNSELWGVSDKKDPDTGYYVKPDGTYFTYAHF